MKEWNSFGGNSFAFLIENKICGNPSLYAQTHSKHTIFLQNLSPTLALARTVRQQTPNQTRISVHVQIVAGRVPAAPPTVLPALRVPEEPEAHQPRPELRAGEKFVIKGQEAPLACLRVCELDVEVPEEVVVVDGERSCANLAVSVAEQKKVLEGVREVGGHDARGQFDGVGDGVWDDERVGRLEALVDAGALVTMPAAAGAVEEVAAGSRGGYLEWKGRCSFY